MHAQVVKDDYGQKGAQPGHAQPVDFELDRITLDIAMEGITCTSGQDGQSHFFSLQWSAHTHHVNKSSCSLQIIKKKVDNFEPDKMIPNCQLFAQFSS